MKKYTILLTFSLLLSSCLLGPNFKKPNPDIPASWVSEPPPKSETADISGWWHLFHDNQLNSLLEMALGNNPDMKIAMLRIKEAQSSLRISEAGLLPTASLGMGRSASSVGGIDGNSRSSYSASARAGWDIDIFGGTRRAIEVSEANLLSTKANALNVRTVLLANVATAYFNWISASEQLRVAKEQLRLQRETLDVAQLRHGAQMTADMDLVQAKAQITNTEATIPSLEGSLAAAKNSLSILLGTYTERVTLKMPSASVYKRVPTVPVGIPSDLLRRRPDMIMAESDLHAVTAQVGVSIANLFPSFSLSGGVSSGSRNFDDLFLSKNAGWSLSGSVSQSIFEGGTKLQRIKQSRIALERSGESYRKTLIKAVSEVEDALINYASMRKRLRILEQVNEYNKKTLEYSRQLYTAGQTDMLNLVSAQRSLLASEESLVTLRQSIRKSFVQLCLALGGGW